MTFARFNSGSRRAFSEIFEGMRGAIQTFILNGPIEPFDVCLVI
jgi:hypothetical protein